MKIQTGKNMRIKQRLRAIFTPMLLVGGLSGGLASAAPVMTIPTATFRAKNGNSAKVNNIIYTDSTDYSFDFSGRGKVTSYQLKYWNNIADSIYKEDSPLFDSVFSAKNSLGDYDGSFTEGEGSYYFSFSACSDLNCSAYSEPIEIVFEAIEPVGLTANPSPSEVEIIPDLTSETNIEEDTAGVIDLPLSTEEVPDLEVPLTLPESAPESPIEIISEADAVELIASAPEPEVIVEAPKAELMVETEESSAVLGDSVSNKVIQELPSENATKNENSESAPTEATVANISKVAIVSGSDKSLDVLGTNTKVSEQNNDAAKDFDLSKVSWRWWLAMAIIIVELSLLMAIITTQSDDIRSM